jgi:hypothetical protein
MQRAIEFCREAICFEMSGVTDLMRETVRAMGTSTITGPDGQTLVGHGGLLVLPSDLTWFEWRVPKSLPTDLPERVGGLITREDPEGPINIEFTTEQALLRNQPMILCAHIREYPDECCRVETYTSEHDDQIEAEVAGNLGVLTLAGLMILNAPYGIKQEEQPLHKKHARVAQSQGFKLRPHKVVYLDKTRPPPPEHTSGRHEPAFHKAFHFVRTHLRHYRDGSRTMVKAHWRGDPRLGICPIPDYRLRA